jgi:hypothetical protein
MPQLCRAELEDNLATIYSPWESKPALEFFDVNDWPKVSIAAVKISSDCHKKFQRVFLLGTFPYLVTGAAEFCGFCHIRRYLVR